jgi:hypothetical protein
MADLSYAPFGSPYGLFGPDQFSNQFSLFNNKALPWPSQYAGMPADAMGRPIQPPAGTTINTSPAAPAPQQAAPAANPSQWAINNDMINAMGRSAVNQMNYQGAPGMGGGYAQGGPSSAMDDVVHMRLQNNAQYGVPLGPGGSAPQSSGPNAGVPGGAAPAQAQQAGPSNNISSPDALSLLANPGPVTTPGAQPGAGMPNQPGAGVLQQFLKNWQPAQSGPGAGFQQNFANTLRGMGYG